VYDNSDDNHWPGYMPASLAAGQDAAENAIGGLAPPADGIEMFKITV